MVRGEVYTWFWWGNLMEREHLEDPGLEGKIVLRRIFRIFDVRVWTESSWLKVGTCGGLL
jgi:hypothetical protein